MFYTIWWPRDPEDEADEPPVELRAQVEKQFLTTVDDDLGIWRHQEWVEDPAYSKVDAKGYATLRKWSRRFYDIPPGE